MVFLCTYLNKAVGGEEDHAEVVDNEDLLQLEGLSVGHQRGPHLHESEVRQTDDEAGPGGGHHEPALHPRVCGGEGKEKQSFTVI